MIWEARHVSVSIDRPVAEVVRYAGDPRRLPEWAAGLAAGIRPDDDGASWVADSPMGEVVVRFAPGNDLGVLDHDVSLPDGTVVHNPFRVMPNGDGSEVVFTVFRRDGADAAAFDADAAAVEADLTRLRDILQR
ncbi:SRPBCC family protein [Pseudolysinimonas kribbensis]|uniref:SRPBCC family protein n=1 Tax=Pseudolysinimonas kribbensis TaxID=433641 RepID=UPI0031DE3FDB